MSMIGYFRIVTDEEIQHLLAHPEEIVNFLYGEDEDAADVESFFGSANEDELDIDKAWHAIHFLLCGEPWSGPSPLNFILAGTEIGDVDVGYGPARAFTAAQVADIAAALDPLSAADLRARFDRAAFQANEIYPAIWDEPLEECLDAYVLPAYEDLKALIQDARDAGQGMMVYMN